VFFQGETVKTHKEFRHVDPDNKLKIKTIPAGTSVDSKHPYYQRMKKEGYFETAKKTAKKKMTQPDAE